MLFPRNGQRQKAKRRSDFELGIDNLLNDYETVPKTSIRIANIHPRKKQKGDDSTGPSNNVVAVHQATVNTETQADKNQEIQVTAPVTVSVHEENTQLQESLITWFKFLDQDVFLIEL